MNLGYEEDELRPYSEPPKDVKDEKLMQVLRTLGYNSQAISDALDRERFEEIHATYLMLKASKTEVDTNLVNNSSSGGQSDGSALTQSSAGQSGGNNSVSMRLKLNISTNIINFDNILMIPVKAISGSFLSTKARCYKTSKTTV